MFASADRYSIVNLVLLRRFLSNNIAESLRSLSSSRPILPKLPIMPIAIEAVKHFSLFAHFLSGIAVLVFYYCGNQEEKDKYLNRLLVGCMSLLFMAIALPPLGLPKPESHDLQNKGFEIPKISQEPLKKD